LEFYITGESYAGHYVPAVSARIVRGNLAGEGIHINIMGSAIGNGLVNPLAQFPQYPYYAFQHQVVDEDEFQEMQSVVPDCKRKIERCQHNDTAGWEACIDAFQTCNTGLLLPVTLSGVNQYDVRIECEEPPLCYNFTGVAAFLEQDYVQRALGVVGREWVDCNPIVNLGLVFAGDWMTSYAMDVPFLLANNQTILVYSGEFDYICNWYGGQAWTHDLQWPGHDAFNNAPNTTWHVNGQVAGSSIAADGFTFLRVANAGHMVPLDQPVNGLELLKTWIKRQPFD